MKKLIFLILPIVLVFSACSKEYVEDDANVMLKKSENSTPVERPMYAWFSCTRDISVPPIILPNGIQLAAAGFVSGHATHIGVVDTKNSRWTLLGIEPGPGMGQMTEYVQGTITGANGDSFFYTSVMTVQMPALTFTGTVTTNGGTGRFVNATGTVIMDGTVDPVTGMPSWTAKGTMTY